MNLNQKRQFADTTIDMVGLGIFYLRRSRVVCAGLVALVALAMLSACGPNRMVSKKKNGTETGSAQSVSIYSGGLDTSFYSQTSPNALGTNARIKKMVQSSDGRFYALGEITKSGRLQFIIEKRLSDGSLDPTLGNGGRVITDIGGSDKCSEVLGSSDTLTVLADSSVKAVEAAELLLGADTVMIAATLEVNYSGTSASGNGTRKRLALLTYNSQGTFVSCNAYSGKLSGEADGAALYFNRDAYAKAAVIDSGQRVFLAGVVGLSGVSSQLSDFSQPSKLYPSKWQLGLVQVMASNGTYDSSSVWGRYLSDPTNDRMRDFFPTGAASVSGKLMVGGTKYTTSGSTYVTQLAASRFDVSTTGNIIPDSQYKVTGDPSAGGSVLFTSTSGYVARAFKQSGSGQYFFAGDLPSQADGSYFVTRLSTDATMIDSTFGNAGGVFKGKQGSYNNRATAIYFEAVSSAVQPKVVIAVEVAQSNLNGTSTSDTYALDDLRPKSLMLARLTSAGILDTTFASTSAVPGTSVIDFTALGLSPDQVSQASGFAVFSDSSGYVVGGQIRLKATSSSVNELLLRVMR